MSFDQLLNEEGLPIIEINEPESSLATTTYPPSTTFDDSNVLPLWTLSPEEQVRRKRERERILDLLEEEERLETLREELSEREKFRQDMERRKEAAKSEIDSLKKAKELQKKMGRALVRSVVESKERKEQEAAQDIREAEAEHAASKASKPLKSKKSVTFAEDTKDAGEDVVADGPEDWGEVASARLSGMNGSGWAQGQTMRTDVIERRGASLRSPPPQAASTPDSDDESEPDELENEDIAPNDASDSDEHDSRFDEEEPISDWGDDQFDTARHQREVALEYYKKRKTVGAQVASAMRDHTHEEGEHEWDKPVSCAILLSFAALTHQQVVPLEATLSSPPPKPSMSKFKASVDSEKARSLPSHSLGPFVVPSSQSHVLNKAIRYGKLENGQLVGGPEGESEDELDGSVPTEEELLRLLAEGQLTNVGPSLRPSSSRPTALASSVVERGAKVSTKPEPRLLSPDSTSENSTVYSPSSSSLSTPIAVTERSSPKAATPTSPSPAPDVKPTSRAPQVVLASQILERPRHSQRQSPARVLSGTDSLPPISGVIHSPDFPIQGSHSAFRSEIIESPAFSVAATSIGAGGSEAASDQDASGVGRRGNEKKKVSRFLAQRG